MLRMIRLIFSAVTGIGYSSVKYTLLRNMTISERLTDMKMTLVTARIAEMSDAVASCLAAAGGRESDEYKALRAKLKALYVRRDDLGVMLMKRRNTRIINKWHSRDFYTFSDADFGDYIGFLRDAFPYFSSLVHTQDNLKTLYIGSEPMGCTVDGDSDSLHKWDADSDFCTKQSEIRMIDVNEQSPRQNVEKSIKEQFEKTGSNLVRKAGKKPASAKKRTKNQSAAKNGGITHKRRTK